jgi:hypothetical protein
MEVDGFVEKMNRSKAIQLIPRGDNLSAAKGECYGFNQRKNHSSLCVQDRTVRIESS